jgi:hypothetical protein
METIYLRPLSEAPKDGTIIGLVAKTTSESEETGFIDFVFYGVYADDETREAWFLLDGCGALCGPDELEKSSCDYFGWFPVPDCEAPE